MLFKIKNLEYKKSNKTILNNLNFNIEEGKHLLILGSSGQIGFHLKEYLGKKNYKVFNFDIVDGKSNDLRKKNNLKLIKLLKKSDYIFFLAFYV